MIDRCESYLRHELVSHSFLVGEGDSVAGQSALQEESQWQLGHLRLHQGGDRAVAELEDLLHLGVPLGVCVASSVVLPGKLICLRI